MRAPVHDPGAGQMKLHVQGREVDLLYTDRVRPTSFSLFLANTMQIDPDVGVAWDLGAGSGILAIMLALLGVPRVVAIDRAAEACELAEENVRRNGVGDRVEVVHADVMTLGSASHCDLLVCNPPTMPGRPRVPGYVKGGGDDGTAFLHRVVDMLPSWLSVSGSGQIVVSSLLDPQEMLAPFERTGLVAVPIASMLTPLRPFYEAAYGAAAIAGFVADGRAMDGSHPDTRDLSEILTVYRIDQLS